MFVKFILLNIVIINLKYVKTQYDFGPEVFFGSEESYASISSENDEILFSNGTWMCGNCTDIHTNNIIYQESYDVNGVNEVMELQFGVSIPHMRCVTVTTDAIENVYHVSGSCTGSITLSVFNMPHFEVTVY